MVLLGGHCFYIKKMDVLCGRWECKGCRQIFTRNEDLIRHLKEEGCTEGKTKIICPGGKFRHVLNSSEKVFYGGDTKFNYTACQWIGAQTIETHSSQNVRAWWRTHSAGLGFKWQRRKRTSIFFDWWIWTWNQHSVSISRMSLAWPYMFKE